jgi:hypothetical protein
MSHQRSEQAYRERKKKYSARQQIFESAFYDRREKELISTIECAYPITVLEDRFPFREYRAVQFAEVGEVLVDTYGQGSFQK